MNIVCIAWGSLLWKPGLLKLSSGWHPGGPRLPLEFARDSDDSAEVALVLCEGAPPMPTYWAYLAADSIEAARAMLAAREKITPARPDWIGSIPSREGALEDARVRAWMRERGIDAAVWTAVPAKFDGREGRLATAGQIVARLDGLAPEQRTLAEEYVRRTPAHIDTPYRRLIEQRLGWTARRDAHVTHMG